MRSGFLNEPGADHASGQHSGSNYSVNFSSRDLSEPVLLASPRPREPGYDHMMRVGSVLVLALLAAGAASCAAIAGFEDEYVVGATGGEGATSMGTGGTNTGTNTGTGGASTGTGGASTGTATGVGQATL